MVLASTQPSLYCTSWFLDAAYPKWEALIWESANNYEAAIPLPTKKRAVLSWVQIPYFVQQTGLVYRTGLDPAFYLSQFFGRNLPFGCLSLHIAFSSTLSRLISKHLPGTWKSVLKKNFLLSLAQPVELLTSNFNENRKRNLKKGYKQGWACEDSENIEEALTMYQVFQLPNQKGVNKKALSTIQQIFFAAQQRGCAELYCVKNPEGRALAYTFFVRFEDRIHYLFGAMNEEGKAHSATSLSFDHVIRKYAGQTVTLDFEGGNMPNIGNYFASFGAIPEEYALVSYQHPITRLISHRK